MRVLLVGEGEHEGSGALEQILNRLRPETCAIEFEHRPNSSFKHHIHGKGDRLFKKFVAILREASQEGYVAAAILMDRDSDPSRDKSAELAQEDSTYTMPRAIGIARETFDAWFLADHVALSTVLQQTISLQPLPERERDPKQRMRGLHAASQNCQPLRDVYCELAKVLNLEHVAARCPDGFGVFAERVRKMLSMLLT